MNTMMLSRAIVAVCVVLILSGRAAAQYSGSGSVSQGRATVTSADIFPGCSGARKSAVGTITSTDTKIWTIPAETRFAERKFLPDLYNQCSGVVPANISAVNLARVPVVVIDSAGEEITAFIFGDNYYEMYINGIYVGGDPVPYTPFNSSVVKFKVARPYTIAFKLVDWEENLGVGTENNNGNAYHVGDGGFMATFSDGTVTDSTWRAQTFYIAPIQDLAAVRELPDGTRSSATATTTPTCNDNCYAIHYEIPTDWNARGFNDGVWPHASLYPPAAVGANNPAYINFLSTWGNAEFIWSSNLLLDNLVLVRKTVGGSTGVNEHPASTSSPTASALAETYPNPFNGVTTVGYTISRAADVRLTVCNALGQTVATLVDTHQQPGTYAVAFDAQAHAVPRGVYFCRITAGEASSSVSMLYVK